MWDFPQGQTDNISNTKTQQVFQMKSVFEELGLAMKITTSTKTQQGEKPNKNQERWYAKYAKVWALHKDAIKLLTWEPLLIVRHLSYNPVSH